LIRSNSVFSPPGIATSSTSFSIGFFCFFSFAASALDGATVMAAHFESFENSTADPPAPDTSPAGKRYSRVPFASRRITSLSPWIGETR
jgi:hypothetical protein